MKTVRFKQVVEKSGSPTVHLVWMAPDRDPVLKAAIKQNRIMTIHQNVRGSAKDYGTIGLLTTPHAQVLIFPKSLKTFADRRVVGIDYSLLNSTEKGGRPLTALKAVRREAAPKKSAESRGSTTVDGDADREASHELIGSARAKTARATVPEGEESEGLRTAEPPAPPTTGEVLVEVEKALRGLRRGQAASAKVCLERLAERLRVRRRDRALS